MTKKQALKLVEVARKEIKDGAGMTITYQSCRDIVCERNDSLGELVDFAKPNVCLQMLDVVESLAYSHNGDIA